MKAVIVDDEILSRDILKYCLSDFPGITLSGEFKNGLEALEGISKLKPDIIFLDIEMPGLSGIDLVEKISGEDFPLIVFVTAFDKYALKAFEANAVDYILKPFDKERFAAAMKKILIRSAGVDSEALKERLLRFLKAHEEREKQEKIVEAGNYIKRIAVKKYGRYILLNVNDIIYFEAQGNYLKITTSKGSFLYNYPMMKIESELPPSLFIRIHRSYIVNQNFVKELKSHSNGEYFITLSIGVTLKISRGYKHTADIIKNSHLNKK